MSRSACSFVCFILANVKRTAAPAEIGVPQTLDFTPQLRQAMNPWDRLCDLPGPGAQNISFTVSVPFSSFAGRMI